MKFSTQLVLSILGITILSLSVFGSIAYWIIDDGHDQTHNELLQHMATTIHKHWLVSKEKTLTQASLNLIHEKFAAPDSILLVEHLNGTRLLVGNTTQTPSAFIAKIKHAIKISNASTANYGSLEIDNRAYHWNISQLPNSQYRLTLLHDDSTGQHQSDFKLGMRLLATSIIIIWMAVWLALLLSSIISRRLKEKNEAIKHQALHDNLTGLPNRNLLFDRLDQAQLAANRNKTSFALLLMDLDNFKEINDALGHHFGDLMLKKISTIIQQTLRENDSIARLGGDEFAVLLPDTEQEGALQCAQKILTSLKTPFNVKDIRIESSASIGIVFYPQDGSDTEILLQRADIAMYQAKKTRSHYVIYDQSRDFDNVRQLTLMNALRETIKNDQLDVYYQPMVDQKTGCTIAAEALARWHHPELGFISPEEFIPIAERTGLIRKLTLSVIKQAMHDCKQWQDMGYEMMVAINISTHCLQDQSFPRKLNQILQTSAISAHSIELEITESALMQDIGGARQVLQQLNLAGYSLSIDDFGTGFSSLAYLKELPVDTLKIDKSFIFDMDSNEDDTAIVQTVIELAHNFNCKVIAEGVETTSSLEQLKGLGNDIAQGYLFSKPIPFEEFNIWLQDSEWAPVSTIKERVSDAI
ncbi:MAG: EAL domain-containing protein [Gammaproteobacteria bacterium]|nr:EAL domain-containing protein [Gammaproteobacteria bacterium]